MNTPFVGTSPTEGLSANYINSGTGAISAGNPVFLAVAIAASSLSNPVTTGANRTDAVQVLSASEGYCAAAPTFLLGVCQKTAQSGEFLSVKCSGFVNALTLVVATRVSSTNNWPAVTAVSEGHLIGVSSYGFSAGAGTQSAVTAGIVALDAVSATASATSNATDTRTAITVAIRAYVRLM